MKKNILWIFIVLISLSFVSAVDKATNINVTNCYNITFEVDQRDGDPADLGFRDCSRRSDGSFFCNCFNTNNNAFWITLQNDGTLLRDARVYDVTMNVYTYVLNEKEIRFRIRDWGDYIENVTNNKTKDLGKVTTYIEVPIFINRTVEVPVEKIVYRDVFIDRVVEDTGRIISCESQLNASQVDNKNKDDGLLKSHNKIFHRNLIILVMSVILGTLIIYTIWDKQKVIIK